MRRFYVYLMLFLCFMINLVTIQNGHNWGDDFAQYLINALNISEGKVFGSGVMLGNPTVSFPGFSILLAPLVKFFGINFKILKLLNVLSWIIALLFLNKILAKRFKQTYVSLAISLLVFSSFFFLFKQNILSDVPFFLIVVLAIYAFDVAENFVLFLIIASIGFWIRPVGALVFICALLVFLQKEQYKKCGLTMLVLIINAFLIANVMNSNLSVLAITGERANVLLNSIFEYFPIVFNGLWYVLLPAQTPFSFYVFSLIKFVTPLLTVLAYFIFLCFFLKKLFQRSLGFLSAFSFLYLSVFVWYARVPLMPESFARYTLPLLPIFLIICGYLHQRYDLIVLNVKVNLIGIVFLVVMSLNIINILAYWNFNDDIIYKRDSVQMMQWVKDNIKEDEHYIFWKPRLLALMTGRVGTATWLKYAWPQKYQETLTTNEFKYIIMINDKNTAADEFRETKDFDLVFKNQEYRILKRRTL